MKNLITSLFLILLTISCKNLEKNETANEEKDNHNLKVAYIGTYTKKEGHVDGKAEGIYTVFQDDKSGAIRFGTTVTRMVNPSFLITSKDKRNLYAVSELGPKDGESGFIHSYSINHDNSLTELNKISTESYAPCHISEDASGNYVFVANYLGGVVMMYEREKNGRLKKIQKIILEDPGNSHPHSVNIAPNNKFVYIADLGKSRIYNFILDTLAGKLIPHTNPYIQLKEGTGPRHFEFSASQKYAFSINEHVSTISVFNIAPSGELSMLNEISTLPEDYTGKNSTADIHLHPSGKFLYASNRGHNTIAAYKFKEETGDLELIGFTPTKGEKPRNFAITKNGKFMYVANQDLDNISTFIIGKDGLLADFGEPLDILTPVCIDFL